jgi:hypothetical protein
VLEGLPFLEVTAVILLVRESLPEVVVGQMGQPLELLALVENAV